MWCDKASNYIWNPSVHLSSSRSDHVGIESSSTIYINVIVYYFNYLHQMGGSSFLNDLRRVDSRTDSIMDDQIDLHTSATLDDGYLGFEIAVRNSNVDRLNVQNRNGWTPLMYACASGNLDHVQLLIQCGADQTLRNKLGQTAFLLAASNGHEDCLRLLDQCPSLDRVDNRGWTPLMCATHRGHAEAAKYLIDKGADVNAFDEASGLSVLMMAATDRFSSDIIVPLLIRNGADYRRFSNRMETAADLAYLQGFTDLADYLRDPFNYHESIAQPPPRDLETLLLSINEGKYWPLFQAKKVSLDQFLAFSELELKDIGIGLLGPRKKMAFAIESYNYEKAMGLHVF